MLFNSIEFLLFFPLVTFLFYVMPHRFRWIHLLLASSFFYMSFVPQYILILLATIVIDFIAAIWIEKISIRRKKLLLIISIISTCLVLFIFKYFDFFNENMILLGKKWHFHYQAEVANFILPIGLSFHTFQSLSYVIEVYRGKQKAEKHFGIYSLYVMFYPQLVTGPIERPQNLLKQLKEKISLHYSNISKGLRLILFGFFIKMVIADNLAKYVDQIYLDPNAYNSLSILIGLLFYSFQIYCDFYGYSLIAVGCAKTLGYDLMDNFKRPYLAINFTEFWQRWHISLSTWFRDYVYFPLGGNKVKWMRWAYNILIVFLLSGLWHGARWNFVLWGLAHALIYLTEHIFNKLFWFKRTMPELITVVIQNIKRIKTFLLVSLVWVFFRSQNMEQISNIFTSLFKNYHTTDTFHIQPEIWLFLGLFILMDFFLFKDRFDNWCERRAFTIRWSIYTGIAFLIIAFSSVENFPFIYFQF